MRFRWFVPALAVGTALWFAACQPPEFERVSIWLNNEFGRPIIVVLTNGRPDSANAVAYSMRAEPMGQPQYAGSVILNAARAGLFVLDGDCAELGHLQLGPGSHELVLDAGGRIRDSSIERLSPELPEITASATSCGVLGQPKVWRFSAMNATGRSVVLRAQHGDGWLLESNETSEVSALLWTERPPTGTAQLFLADTCDQIGSFEWPDVSAEIDLLDPSDPGDQVAILLRLMPGAEQGGEGPVLTTTTVCS